MSVTHLSRTEALAIVEQYRKRSGTQKDFCAEHNIKKATLGYWVCKLSREQRSAKDKPAFIKLRTQPIPSAIPQQNTVMLPNGIRLIGGGVGFPQLVSEIYRKTI